MRLQAQAEGLTLTKADSKTGYFGVYHHPGKPKPYQARVRRGGNTVHLGSFATAEEAALCVARSPEGQKKAAAERPPPDEEKLEARREAAISAARSEKLTLLVAAATGRYCGVSTHPGRSKPYQARVWRGGRHKTLGYFATAEEAALCVALTPEGQKTATRRAKKDGSAKRPRH